jgi:transcriptional regulator with XRE-family HTH domain
MTERLDPRAVARELRRAREIIMPTLIGLPPDVEITQNALADHLGLGHRTYNRYESGSRAPKLPVLTVVRQLVEQSSARRRKATRKK